jgi:uncharacterized protein (DUF4415 family)
MWRRFQAYEHATVVPCNPNQAPRLGRLLATGQHQMRPGMPATAVKHPKLNMRMDADVRAAFKATGQGWQTRINAAPREAAALRLTKSQFDL